MASDTQTATPSPRDDDEDGAPVPEHVKERWRARRRSIVKGLRVLCALPALMVLWYALFPPVRYTYHLTLAAPGAASTVDLGEVRLEQRDRALALIGRDGAGKDRRDLPLLLVRNNLRSAALYHKLRELERPERVFLVLRPATPAAPGQSILGLDSWALDVQATSNFTQGLGRRLLGLLLGLGLVALAALLIPRLVHVLWPDR